jgi:hypothetical protein
MPAERGNHTNGEGNGFEPEKSDKEYSKQDTKMEGPGACLDPGNVSRTPGKRLKEKGFEKVMG